MSMRKEVRKMFKVKDILDLQEIISEQIYDEQSGYNNLLKAKTLYAVYFTALAEDIPINEDIYELYDKWLEQKLLEKAKKENFNLYIETWCQIETYLEKLEKRNVTLLSSLIKAQKGEND